MSERSRCEDVVRASGAAPGMLLGADHCDTQISLESSHFHQFPPLGPRYVNFDSLQCCEVEEDFARAISGARLLQDAPRRMYFTIIGRLLCTWFLCKAKEMAGMIRSVPENHDPKARIRSIFRVFAGRPTSAHLTHPQSAKSLPREDPKPSSEK